MLYGNPKRAMIVMHDSGLGGNCPFYKDGETLPKTFSLGAKKGPDQRGESFYLASKLIGNFLLKARNAA